MLFRKTAPVSLVLLAVLAVPAARAADPTDNPVATFYSGPEGYPAWTDEVNWRHVINMKTYTKGKTEFEKFEKARDELSEGGGVLYYPAGTYDFSNKLPGRGLMLVHGVVIRGEAPAGHPVAADGKLELPTKFIFPFRDRYPKAHGMVPADWNVISLQPDDFKHIKSIDHIGIAWVHLVGATVDFGPEVNWGKTWGTAGALLSNKLKEGGWSGATPPAPTRSTRWPAAARNTWAPAAADSSSAASWRTPPCSTTSPTPATGRTASTRPATSPASPCTARASWSPTTSCPHSSKNFRYTQKTTAKEKSTVVFDYGKTIGIDVNKELLAGRATTAPAPATSRRASWCATTTSIITAIPAITSPVTGSR